MTARFRLRQDTFLLVPYGDASASPLAFHRSSDLLHYGLYINRRAEFWTALPYTTPSFNLHHALWT